MTGQTTAGNGRAHPFTVCVRRDVQDRLTELAAAAGVSRAQLVRELLEELVPRIDTVTRRTAIKLRQPA